MESDRERWFVPLEVASPRRFAEMAESIAFSFERLAATYRRMAERPRSPHEMTRLLRNVARLEDQADHERTEAVRLRHLGEL